MQNLIVKIAIEHVLHIFIQPNHMLHGTGELELTEEAAISLLDKFSCLLKPVSTNVSRLRPSHFLPSVNTMSLNLPVGGGHWQ